jgi:hypothetical protein
MAFPYLISSGHHRCDNHTSYRDEYSFWVADNLPYLSICPCLLSISQIFLLRFGMLQYFQMVLLLQHSARIYHSLK